MYKNVANSIICISPNWQQHKCPSAVEWTNYSSNWTQQREWMNSSSVQSHDWISQNTTLGWSSETQKDTYDMVMVPFTHKKFENRQNQSVVFEARIISSELILRVLSLICRISNEYRPGLWGSVIQVSQMPPGWGGSYWLKGHEKDSPGASNVFVFPLIWVLIT